MANDLFFTTMCEFNNSTKGCLHNAADLGSDNNLQNLIGITNISHSLSPNYFDFSWSINEKFLVA